MKMRQKGFGLLAVIVLVAVACLIGFFSWRVYNSNKVDEYNTSPLISGDECSQSSEICTYKNEEVGFSISYPSRWGKVLEINADDIPATEVNGYVQFNFFNTSVVALGGPMIDFHSTSPGRIEFASGISGDEVFYPASLKGPEASYTDIISGHGDKGLITYDVEQDRKKYYHAIFELHSEMSALNIWAEASYTNDARVAGGIEKATFEDLARSVVVH